MASPSCPVWRSFGDKLREELVVRVAHATVPCYFHFQSQKQNIDINRQAKFAATPSLALFVNLKNVVCKIGEDAEVLMSLYDPVESKFIRSVTCPGCCLNSWVSVRKMASILLLQGVLGGIRWPHVPQAAELVPLWDTVRAASLVSGPGSAFSHVLWVFDCRVLVL